MIETIYRMENEESSKPDISIRLPKNIKQIGQSSDSADSQIYIEENVISYIKQPADKEGQIRYGVLLGEIKKGNGYTYVFVNGAVEVEEVIESSIIFGEEVWTSIYDSIKRYYKEGIVVGWYGSFESNDAIDMQRIRKLHLDHFAGNHKVFLKVDREEDEEAFYIYERNGLMKQSCYHIYFEKSDAFEDYLFATGREERLPRVKESTREKGKYGIALNNTIGNRTQSVKEPAKWNMGRVASWGTMLVLGGVIAAMGLNGDLDALGGSIKGLADNILDRSQDDEPDFDNIIPINGSPSSNNEEPSSSSEDESSEGESSENELSEKESSENESSDSESAGSQSDSDGKETAATGANEDETDDVSAKPEEPQDPVENESTEPTENDEDETDADNEKEASAGATNYKTYIVEKGDTLYSISMSVYGSAEKIKDIVDINDLDDEDYVMVGQKIFLP